MATKKTSTTAVKAQSAGAKSPADRKDETAPEKKVRNVRALGGEVSLEWDGDTYTIERDAIDDVEFVLELEQGKNLSAIVRLLGTAQWETFKARNRVDGARVPYSEAEAFLTELLEKLQKVANSGN